MIRTSSQTPFQTLRPCPFQTKQSIWKIHLVRLQKLARAIRSRQSGSRACSRPSGSNGLGTSTQGTWFRSAISVRDQDLVEQRHVFSVIVFISSLQFHVDVLFESERQIRSRYIAIIRLLDMPTLPASSDDTFPPQLEGTTRCSIRIR